MFYWLQEASQAVVPYWRRDNLRNNLKTLKKKLDDLDRQQKASVVNDVRISRMFGKAIVTKQITHLADVFKLSCKTL
jgi:hypothetical protein